MIQLRTFLTVLVLALPWASHAQTGNVGIGTTSPAASAALDVTSTTKGVLLPRLSLIQRQAMGTGSIAAPVAGLVIYQTDNTPGLYAYSGSSWVLLAADNLGNHTATRNLDLGTNQLVGNGGTNGLSVSSNGNVGVGTTSPNDLFAVEKAGGQQVVLGGGGDTGSELKLLRSGVSHISLYNNNGGLTIANTSALAQTNVLGTPLMSVGSNVGIGTTTPTAKLDVNGNANVTGTLQLNTADMDKIFLTTAGAAGSKIAHASGWGVLNYAGPGIPAGGTVGRHSWLTTVGGAYTEQMRLTATGQLGIGTTTPRGKLDVDGGGDTYLVDDSNNGTSQSAFLPGHLWLAPYSGTSGTAYIQARVPNSTASTSIGLTLRTTSAGTLTDAVTISPAGDAAVKQAVLARALITGDYEFGGGPDVYATNQDHIASCPTGYAAMSLAVYATNHMDGNMRVNCTNLTGIMATTGAWTSLSGGAGGTHERHCPTGQVATGWRMHAGGYLDGNLGLYCQPLLTGYTRGFETITVQLQSSAVVPPSTGLKHQYMGATCPAGTFLTGVSIQRSPDSGGTSGAMENLNEVYCAGIRTQ